MAESLSELNGKSVVHERLVSSAESNVRFSCVCSLAEGRTHLVLSHGGSLSVREVRKNHVETVATYATPSPVVFLTVIRRQGFSGVIFLLLSNGALKLLGLSRSGGVWEVFENWSRSLDWGTGGGGSEVLVNNVRCEYDEQRCAVVVFAPVEPVRVTEVAHAKKRSVVIRDVPPLVYLLRFSFDKFPKILTKVDSVKWKFDWCPTLVSFLRSSSETAPWSFGCYHASVGIKTFAIKIESGACDFRELKLAFAPPHSMCDMRFIEGTTLLVAHANELAIYSGSKLTASVKYAAALTGVRIFPLNRVGNSQSFIVALSDGTLHLATVGEGDQLTLNSVFLGNCAGKSMATTVAHLSTVTFKQGPCFLIFVGSLIGDSSISFVVPSNPKRRIQHLISNLSLAPVSGIVSAPAQRRVYLSFGIGADSGVAFFERLFRYRCLMRFPTESAIDAFVLGDSTCAIALENSTRIFELSEVAANDECRIVEHAFPYGGKTVAMWLIAEREKNMYVRVTTNTVELLTSEFGIMCKLELESNAVAAVSDCSYNSKSPSLMVLSQDATIRRIVFDATLVSLHFRGSVAFPNYSGNASQLICVGLLQNILIAISSGVLHSDQGKFGLRWDPFPVRSLTGKTVVAIAASQHKNTGEAPFVYVAALCHSAPNAKTRNWYIIIFAFWLISPSTSASDAIVFLFAENAENSPVSPLVCGNMRFSSDSRYKYCVSVDVSGTVYVVVQNLQDSWMGLRAADEFAPLATLTAADTKVSLLSSLSGAGLALGWQGEVSYIPALLYRHSTTVLFVTVFPDLALVVALDDSGKLLALHTNQTDAQTRRVACQRDVFTLPDGVVVSDMQRVAADDGSALLAIAFSTPPPATSEQRLAYHGRQIMFLGVSTVLGAAVIRPVAGLAPIVWSGVGSCQLQFRPLSGGRIVAACDAHVKLFSLPAQGDAKQLLSTELRSGNDIVASLSVQGPMVTISHMFGSLVALKCSSSTSGEFEGSFKAAASGATDGAVSLMLNEDVCVAASNSPFFTVLACVSNKLVPVWRVPVEGPVCAGMFERSVGFLGTAAGEVIVARVVSPDAALKLVGKAESGVYDLRAMRLAIDSSVLTLPKNIEDLVTWI